MNHAHGFTPSRNPSTPHSCNQLQGLPECLSPGLFALPQIRTHSVTGAQYWAVVAVGVMPSSAVTILREYDGTYDNKASGSLAVGFLDEMEAVGATRGSAGLGLGQRVLEGHVAWVTREWLESCFRSPSWWVAR